MLELTTDRIAGGSEVLDIGCGPGWLLAALAQAGTQPGMLRGLEPDPARAAAARQRVPGATIEQGDARKLPYADGRFGVVALMLVLSSVQPAQDVPIVLGEARRVLAPGGVLMVYEPRLANPLNRETHLIRNRHLDRAGLAPRTARTLTLLPPVGRRLGRLTPRLHPALSRVPVLRSHRLVAFVEPAFPE